MRRGWSRFACGVAILFAAGLSHASDEDDSVCLVVAAGRPLRVALDSKVKVKRVGQPVTGTLIESVYSYDRVVLPAGSEVFGHVEKLGRVSTGARLRALLRGDLTPPHAVTLEFERVVLADGTAIAIETQVGPGIEGLSLAIAGASEKSKVARAKEEIKRRVDETLAPLRGPGKWERAKDWLVGQLPVHPQYLRRGTVYSAQLTEPVEFGMVKPTESAPDGIPPAPESVLTVRLVTPVSSADTPRGTPIQAVLTKPVFSDDNRLILPEGTELSGEVTFAKAARRLHRNGQLRFLFETVKAPEREPEELLASLHSMQLGGSDRVAVDEEGGASATSSKARFIAPTLALLSTRASIGHDRDNDFRGARPEGSESDPGGRGIGGFIGLHLLGSALAQASRPVAVVLSVFGFVRTGYGAVFGRGQEVVIPANTPMELQLAPSPTKP